MFFAIKDQAVLEKVKDTLCVSFGINPKSIKEKPEGSKKPKLLHVIGHEEETERLRTLLKCLDAV